MKNFRNTNAEKKRKRKENTIVVPTLSLAIFFILGTLLPSINIVPNAFGVDESETESIEIKFNEPTITEIDDVAVEINPVQDKETGLTSLNMKVTDKDTKLPLTHVDWLISIKDQNNKLYESSTQHSHVGLYNFEYALDKGTYNILTQVASLGPKMMGMEVPGMAQTRILESGDPMEGWKTDPNKFFGFKNVNFILAVDNGVATNTSGQLAPETDTNSQDPNKNSQITVSSETGKKVNVKVVTVPEKIVAGQPATVALDIMTENGTSITHPDGLLTVSKDGFTLLKSAEKGNPMMPVNGAFHGHTGQLAFNVIFPQAGVYTLDAKLNSLPVSNVMFGNVDTKFDLGVVDAASSSTEQVAGTSSTNPNQVSIIGQEQPFYSPTNFEVKKGTTLTFKNDDAIVHVIASTNDKIGATSPNADGKFDTGILMMGQESTGITLDEPGTINYFCTVHPFMQGSITVT
ncbi:MAG TPA: plastocyanin/azurin family copper-binding protein [Nitrososphaeraceae archaeon]|nr:plastocyanin/azurin family copper-binding protein [Nitrososphaeraceae archaeon]